MTETILCVDDEPSVLQGIQRMLRREFELHTAVGAEEGLRMIADEGPYAVVVSDQRMPGMDGVRFLAQVRKCAPDTIRMMLTGQADRDTAIEAINEGSIFRFLTKPCSAEDLTRALKDGIEQYRLVNAERELLDKTVKGSIRTLVEVLSLSNPLAFSRVARLRSLTVSVVKALDLPNVWQYEIAALLSQLGCMALPADVLKRYLSGHRLTPQEKEMVDSYPEIGGKLVAHIPKLDASARMISQQRRVDGHFILKGDPIRLGAQVLRTVVAYDLMVGQGKMPPDAISTLSECSSAYCPEIVHILKGMVLEGVQESINVIPIANLEVGMKLAEDVRTLDGKLLVSKDHEVTEVIQRCLVYYHQQKRVGNTVQIVIAG